ncbi:protein translocase subunit SecA protein [Artemisia annua]|uniref:Protein translocase subunit SecA protein n=1 Tax=Artemisia annua TaxID=35608 RepID=A0A2U1KSW1_ARTAN|nr:protein translocase subunit SecA protein [Artemisia annua]
MLFGKENVKENIVAGHTDVLKTSFFSFEAPSDKLPQFSRYNSFRLKLRELLLPSVVKSAEGVFASVKKAPPKKTWKACVRLLNSRYHLITCSLTFRMNVSSGKVCSRVHYLKT